MNNDYLSSSRRHVLKGTMVLAAGLATGCTAPSILRTRGDEPVEINTRQGRLRGAYEENGVRVWRGVRYAEPPIDELRGRPPRVSAPWTGVRSAQSFGSTAVQIPKGGAPGQALEGSEDCLFVNIWAPATRSERARPVIVWIHGGAFIVGAGSLPGYSGALYAQEGDLVFVTLNYRLGGFGYLMCDRDPECSNLGLLDQVAALRWVQENISMFGGDPGNVTVMGESAGGMSTSILLGTPAARGLFHKAIVQSGGVRPLFTTADRHQRIEQLINAAGLKTGQQDRLIELPTDELNAAFSKISAGSGTAFLGGEPYRPEIGGQVLPVHPARNLASVPTMIGHCDDEAEFFMATGARTLTQGLPLRMKANTGEKVWAAISELYSKTQRSGRTWQNDLLSDAFTVLPSLRLAEGLTARGAKVWNYRFAYSAASQYGPCHISDVNFTFGNPEASMLRLTWNEDAQRLSQRMRQAIITFAHKGSPQTSELPLWPVHNSRDLPYMTFDRVISLDRDWVGTTRREAWRPVLDEAF